jgi:SAM-dependent methyltransferase
VSDGNAWHQDDDFWSDLAPFMFGQEAWSITPGQVSNALVLMGVEAGARILDLACGPGRHSIELARRGFEVTGVDRTTEYLEEARGRAELDNLSIEFVQDDMRRFVRPDTFDAAFSMFTSFGYFEQPADNQQVLINVYSSLKKGGVFLLDMVGREILARIFQSRDWREHNGTLLLHERKMENNWTIMRNRQILIKDNQKKEFVITHWIYSGSELAEMFRESGFSSVDLFGSLEGAPYDQDAKRLIVVARK